MKIFNTLTREKEEFIPITPNKVKMYLCGPTVYNYIHIGNARPLCVFDTLRRYLEYRGYEVTFVQNFTDVDDKIIRKANEEGIPAKELSEKYIKEFLTDSQGLNVKEATYRPKVTENIGNIIKIIKDLIAGGHAYESDGDVYFRTKSFAEYGKLSHMPLEDLEAGARIDVSEQKEDPVDFALWKTAKPNEPSWASPWGKGRPGWHIECSAMSRNLLGDTIDLHCGGQDLIFPHHENEIAQSECATGKQFANYWMHNGYLNVDNKKMSKSLNNFFTAREVSQTYGYEPIRFLMLQAQYRTPVNYTTEILEQCRSSLDRMYNCLEMLRFAIQKAPDAKINAVEKAELDGYRERFVQAMEDDLNTADAISVVFDLVRLVNGLITQDILPSKGRLAYSEALFLELTGVLGLLYCQKEESVPQEVLDLVEERAIAKQKKDYAAADGLRERIAQLGYQLEETRQGVKVKKVK